MGVASKHLGSSRNLSSTLFFVCGVGTIRSSYRAKANVLVVRTLKHGSFVEEEEVTDEDRFKSNPFFFIKKSKRSFISGFASVDLQKS
jgi:hypothetical protein